MVTEATTASPIRGRVYAIQDDGGHIQGWAYEVVNTAWPVGRQIMVIGGCRTWVEAFRQCQETVARGIGEGQ